MTSRSKRFTSGLNQTAVYWDNPTNDGYGGRTFDDPAEVDCRWEERKELFIDTTGQEQQSSAIVYVSEDVVVGGYLFLGDLGDLSSGEEADPQTAENTYEIRGFNKSPDKKADDFMRKVYL